MNRKIKSKRIIELAQLSAHRYLYVMDIMQEKEVDKELMEWIEEAHNRTKKETTAGI